MELQPEALPFHELDRCPPSPASFHQPFCDCPATLVMTMAPSRPTCLSYSIIACRTRCHAVNKRYSTTYWTPPNAWPLRLATTPLTSVMRRCSASAACLQTWLAKPAARTRSRLSFVPRWSRPFVITLQRLPHSRSYGSEGEATSRRSSDARSACGRARCRVTSVHRGESPAARSDAGAARLRGRLLAMESLPQADLARSIYGADERQVLSRSVHVERQHRYGRAVPRWTFGGGWFRRNASATLQSCRDRST